ncbi:hypothetical protein, partial [Luteibacter sp.]|uniref:hypothetical protein n=1 Tax=Luteibacter sp. TaxID=1886636 RepID=UPI002F41E038
MVSASNLYGTLKATGALMPDLPRAKAHAPQAKPTPRDPVQHWAYPFALRDTSATDSMHSHFKALAGMTYGFFPLSSNGF